MKNSNNLLGQKGQASKILIIAALAVFFIIVLILGFVKFVSTKRSSDLKSQSLSTTDQTTAKPPENVYEKQIGDIRFILDSSEDLGKVIKSKSLYGEDLTTTEKFIKVAIGAQNKGKENTKQRIWEVGNIIDSEGRNFVSINEKIYSFQLESDLCGAVLKPEFAPVQCVKYYEISRVSEDLRVIVRVTEPKKQEALINLNLNQ